ncbi:hypothetical protein RRG08_000200 [Elysia crispata]|uniref:Uncharacterized protein n=1 Tax=Elysia crispata TaxID=231223 RepID=A0AAE0YWS1_9GAST|nr:hypothetical protein RRG08_000200 [Elysia crispata]
MNEGVVRTNTRRRTHTESEGKKRYLLKNVVNIRCKHHISCLERDEWVEPEKRTCKTSLQTLIELKVLGHDQLAGEIANESRGDPQWAWRTVLALVNYRRGGKHC